MRYIAGRLAELVFVVLAVSAIAFLLTYAVPGGPFAPDEKGRLPEVPIQLINPYLKGMALTPDNNGIQAIDWPGLAGNCTVREKLYIGGDAPTERQETFLR